MNGLSYEFKGSGEELTVSCSGKLNTNTVPELTEEMQKRIDGVKSLTIDLAGLEYMSSAGLRLVVELQKSMTKCGGKMALRHVNDEVMDVFELTGLSHVLKIEA